MSQRRSGGPLSDQILLYPQDAEYLRHVAQPVGCHDQEVAALIEFLLSTVDGVGVGLAATQLGYPWRVVVMDLGDGMRPYINPQVEAVTAGQQLVVEACLSVPGLYGLVSRAQGLTLSWEDFGSPSRRQREVLEFPAAIVQHELDHLAGVLYLDRAVQLYQVEGSPSS